jgi:glycosyltransferase involved in cell wall biosynthesis
VIVHVASGREWRGGQRQVWLLARELGRRGVPQVVVTSARSELARRLTLDGIRIEPTSWRAGLDPRVLPAIWHRLSGSALLHAHDAHSVTLTGLSALLRDTPTVVTRRVAFPLRHPFFWRRACRVIAISSAVRDVVLQGGIDPERVTIIPSALDPDVSDCSGFDVRATLGLPASARLAMQLAALTPEKDQATLLAAASHLVQDLPDLHWVIVGEGPCRPQLEQMLAQMNLSARVHLLGALEDAHRALRQADVFVLSSVSEGLGSSILAAMAMGVPVVATRVGGVPDLVKEGGGLLVSPRAPAALAAEVRRLFLEPSLRDRLVATASGEIQKFSVAAMADQVLSVYRSCAHSLDGT